MAKVEVAVSRAHRLLGPGPVALLTSQYRGQVNVMAASLTRLVSLDPPLVGVSIHPSRLTHEFVSRAEAFVLNLPHLEQLGAVHRCGLLSGRDGDKFVAVGLTPAPATVVEAPLVAECLAHLECGVVDRARFGDHDCFVAQVLTARAEEEAFDGLWRAGEEAGQLLHHLGENCYAALGNRYRA